jgi:hypothetical protein
MYDTVYKLKGKASRGVFKEHKIIKDIAGKLELLPRDKLCLALRMLSELGARV